eukprot:6252127-Amphidinium_carterae.1
MASTVFGLIKSGAAVSTELVTSLWQEKCSINASTSWVRSYLHDLGLSFKSATLWRSTTSIARMFTTWTKLPATSFLHSPRP